VVFNFYFQQPFWHARGFFLEMSLYATREAIEKLEKMNYQTTAKNSLVYDTNVHGLIARHKYIYS